MTAPETIAAVLVVACAGVAIGWCAMFGGAAALARSIRHTSLADLWSAAFVGVAAAAAAAAVPFGPVGFAGAERLPEVWSEGLTVDGALLAIRVPVAALGLVGLTGEAAMRLVLCSSSAALAVSVFAVARLSGLDRVCALVAPVVAICWPAQLRYAGDPSETLPTAALLAAATAAAAAAAQQQHVPAARAAAWMLAGAVVLTFHARPESPLLGCLLLLVGCGTGRARRLGVVAVIVGGATSLAVAVALPSQTARADLAVARVIHNTLHAQYGLLDWSIAPAHWYAVAAVGLVVGQRLPRPLRAVWVVNAAALLVAFPTLGHEYNPLWGQARYYLLLLAPVAVLSAVAVAWFGHAIAGARGATVAAAAALAAAVVPTVTVWRPLLDRPIELQAEHAFVRATALRVGAGEVPVLALDGGCETPRHLQPETLVALALGAGGARTSVMGCEALIVGQSPVVIRASAVLLGCAEAPQLDGALLYLGGYAPPACVAGIAEAFVLEPVVEEDVVATAIAPVATTTCRGLGTDFVGADAEPCRYRVGWYRIGRRSPS